MVHDQTVLAQDAAGRADVARPAVAPRRSATADVMALQPAIGNRALTRAIQTRRVGASPPPRPTTRVIARQTGLRLETNVNDYADDALKWWRDPANKDKSLEDYAKQLVAKANARLKTLGSYECKAVIDKTGTSNGTFGRTTWTIKINPDKFTSRPGVTKVGQLTAKEAAEIAETIYHESRHSEQYFRIACVQAGRLKAGIKDPGAKIAADMSIPKEVADHAAKSPLKASASNTKEIDEIESWESITVGRHRKYKGNINVWNDEVETLDRELQGVGPSATAADLDKVKASLENKLSKWTTDRDRQKFVKSHLAQTNKLRTKTEMDNRVVTHLTAIKSNYDAFVKAATEALKKWKKASAADRLTSLQALRGTCRALYKAVYDAYRAHIH